ncbi:MAG TPA: DUF2141 domain-containing protein [Candidatus Binataceae bacterium]|nr:DUF2141 domain-containing protein [Candidatus Binataceae bacterium]
MKPVRECFAPAFALLAIIAVALAAFTTTSARAQSPTAIATPAAASPDASGKALMVEVVGLRNDHGQVGCSLFNDAKAFPRDDKKIFRHVWAPIHGGRAMCRYVDIPPGTYAAVVFHDENSDGEFNQNAFGMPLEGYGFSNDAAALFAPPSFKDASFTYNGRRLYTVINIRY